MNDEIRNMLLMASDRAEELGDDAAAREIRRLAAGSTPWAEYGEGTFVLYRERICPVTWKPVGMPPGFVPIWLGEFMYGRPLIRYVSTDEVEVFRDGTEGTYDQPPPWYPAGAYGY